MYRSGGLLLLLLFLIPLLAAGQGRRGRGGKGKKESCEMKCMTEAVESKAEEKAYQKCYQKTMREAKMFFKANGTNINSGIIAALKADLFTKSLECMMNELPYVADGNIDVTLLQQDINGTASRDPIRDLVIRYIKLNCTGNLAGSNFTEDYLDFKECVNDEVEMYCEDNKYMVEMYYERDFNPSACAPLEVDPKVLDIFANAVKGGGRRNKGRGGQRRGGGRRGRKGQRRSRQGRRALDPAMKSFERLFRVAEMMQVYAPDTGLNFTKLREYVFNMTNPIPSVQEELLAAMDDCQTNFTNIQEQLGIWYMCLNPRVLDICGFGNNVTTLLFPFLENQLAPCAQEMAIKDLEEAWSFDSDEEDDDDDFDEVFFRKKREVGDSSGESGGSGSTESLELSGSYIL